MLTPEPFMRVIALAIESRVSIYQLALCAYMLEMGHSRQHMHPLNQHRFEVHFRDNCRLLKSIVSDHWFNNLLASTNSKNVRLWRVYNCTEVINRKHPQV